MSPVLVARNGPTRASVLVDLSANAASSLPPTLVVCGATCARDPLHVFPSHRSDRSLRSTTEAAEELDVDSSGHQRVMSFISDREQASAHRATTALGRVRI